MSGRLPERHTLMTHMEECGFLTSLLIDLKLREMGREPREPITMDRLNEASKCVGKIQACRERGLYR